MNRECVRCQQGCKVGTISSPRPAERAAVAHHLVLGGGRDQLLAEVLPVLIGRGLLDDDLLVVVCQLEDDVLVLLGQLQLIVGRYAVLRNGSSGRRASSVSTRHALDRRY